MFELLAMNLKDHVWRRVRHFIGILPALDDCNFEAEDGVFFRHGYGTSVSLPSQVAMP